MHLIEILMISVGISLNVFSAVVCFGAVLLKIEQRRLIRMLAIYCLIQVLAVIVGRGLAMISVISRPLNTFRYFCYLIAAVIFIVLGIFMLRKAIKNEPIIERLTDIRYKKVVITGLITGIDAVFAGFAFGLMKAALVPVAVCTFAVTAAVVICGLYTGYRLGYEQKTKAYAIGGILLLGTALEIILRYMIGLPL